LLSVGPETFVTVFSSFDTPIAGVLGFVGFEGLRGTTPRPRACAGRTG
jgi:hypothetical protein